MPPTPFSPRHETPFKSSISSSQQIRKHVDELPSSSNISDQWPPPISSAQLDSRHWTYLAEGGKNLLLRYEGPGTYPYIGPTGGRLALRLRKIDRNASKEEQDQQDEIDPIEWSDSVIKTDLKDCCALPPLLRLRDSTADGEEKKMFVRQIAAKIESMRPMERRKKSGLDETIKQDILVTEDLSAEIKGKQVICLEVKPKCGFLPFESARLSSETEHVKRRFSRYRMHRVLKSKTAPTLAELNAFYDPLDLYSGQEDRVEKAAKALYSDWLRGEGNLRIFCNGRRMEGIDGEDLDEVIQKQFSFGSLESMLAKHLADKKLQDVLRRLAQLQAKYDNLDVEGVASLYLEETGESITVAKESPVSLSEYQEAIKEGATTNARQAIVKLLLSTMYKDCSIFVCCISGDEPTIHLVDLDPKPVNKLRYLYELDQNICRHFIEWSREVGIM
jgi:inositol-pentakisphosphate 2-kinase